MSTPDLLEPPASEREAEMAKVAQRCLMAALDHSRPQRIALVDEKGLGMCVRYGVRAGSSGWFGLWVGGCAFGFGKCVDAPLFISLTAFTNTTW